MKENCVIKSGTHGLTLILDPDAPFEELVTDVCRKFAGARDFFGEVSLVIEFEGREISGEEASVLVEAVELNSDITIKLIAEHSELKDRDMYGKLERFYFDRVFEDARIVIESVPSGESLTSDNSIVIIGDVRDGASVYAAGNIIIYGGLYGQAHAGCKGNDDCYIVAGSYDGSDVSVGHISGAPGSARKGLFKRKSSHTDAVAICVWDGQLVSEPVNKGILKDIAGRRADVS